MTSGASGNLWVCPLSPARGGRRKKSDGLRSTSPLQDQGEISLEASAFQREEVELAKPFLVWHVVEATH